MNKMTSNEKQAIYNITTLMMMIDGRVTSAETDYWRKVPKVLEMTEPEMRSAASMDRNTAISILRSMNATNKIISIKIFTEMMLADGRVDEKEEQLLNYLCDTVNVEQAAMQLNGLDNIKEIIAPYGR